MPTLGTVSYGQFGNTSSTPTVSGLSISAGTGILVFATVYAQPNSSAVDSIFDNASSLYTLIASSTDDEYQTSYLFYCASASGLVTSVTANLNQNQYTQLVIMPVTGAGSSPFDNYVAAQTTGNPSLTPNQSPSLFDTERAPDLLIAVGGTERGPGYTISNVGGNPSSGWTVQVNALDNTNEQSVWCCNVGLPTTGDGWQFSCDFSQTLNSISFLVAMGLSAATVFPTVCISVS